MTSQIRSMARLTGLVLVLLLCAGDAWAQRDRRGSFRTQRYELGPRDILEAMGYAAQFGFTVDTREISGSAFRCDVSPRPRKHAVWFRPIVNRFPPTLYEGGGCLFDLFGGRELRSGWRLAEWDVRAVPLRRGGEALAENVIVDVRPGEEGERSLHTRFRVMDERSIAAATTMVLEGPPGRDWREAFHRDDGPEGDTREYRLSGGAVLPALQYAASRGFRNQSRPITTRTKCQLTPTGLFVGSDGPGFGNMACRFDLLERRRLADGWTIERVRLRNDGASYDWNERPELGTDDASFSLNVRTGGGGGEVQIRALVLEGPPGQNWKDAFRP